jgi:serine protease AprX
MNRSAKGLGLLLTLCASGAILAGQSGASADPLKGKCDQFLAKNNTCGAIHGWTNVIVRVDGSLSEARLAQLKALSADPYRQLPLIHSVAIAVPTRNLERLAALPFVSHLSKDVAVRKYDEFTVGSSEAGAAWQSPYNLSGNGVTVAVVDSGVHSLLDLNVPGLLGTGLLSSNRIAASVNFVPGTSSADDTCGHGTHVSGIIAGNGQSSSGLGCYHTYYGIAPKAKVVNVRVLDQKGQGTVSQVVSGIQWCVSNKSKYSIRVLNLSLGHPVGESSTTDPLCQAVEQAWKSGIVVVCAAGNDGRMNDSVTNGMDNEGYGTEYGSIQCPGNDPYVVTVGATKSIDGKRADDKIATYSSRGPSRLDLVLKPDIIAPGNKIVSTLAPNSYLDANYSKTNQVPLLSYVLGLLGANANKYFVLSGTSMASPVVAGAAALMLQAQPTLTPDTIKARLMISADKWLRPDGTADPCTYGAGYLNIPAALSSRVVATQPAMSPTLSEDSSGNVYINMDRALWGSSIWGTGVADLRAVWGTRAIWGSSVNTIDASRAVWGTSVWSDRAVWGTTSGAVDLSSKAIVGD